MRIGLSITVICKYVFDALGELTTAGSSVAYERQVVGMGRGGDDVIPPCMRSATRTVFDFMYRGPTYRAYVGYYVPRSMSGSKKQHRYTS